MRKITNAEDMSFLMTETDLIENIEFSRFTIKDRAIINIKFKNCVFSNITFENVRFDNVQFSHGKMWSVIWNAVSCTYMHFERNKWTHSKFTNACFRNCTFECEYFGGVQFIQSKFEGSTESRLCRYGWCTFDECECTVNPKPIDNNTILDWSTSVFEGIIWRNCTGFESTLKSLSICPEGDIIGWKQCRNNIILKLRIPEGAKRLNSPSHRKCRAEYAYVLGAYHPNGSVVDKNTPLTSLWSKDFEYKVGNRVEPTTPFNEDIWTICGEGIHFFLTREEAVNFKY